MDLLNLPYFQVKRGTCGVATRCAAAEATRTGKPGSVPEKTGFMIAEPCDVNAAFGDIMGKTQIYFYLPNGKKKHSNVKCAHGKCTSTKPHEGTNTCMILCGRPTCGRDALRPPK